MVPEHDTEGKSSNVFPVVLPVGPALGSGAQHRDEGSPFLNIWVEVNPGGDSGQRENLAH